MSDIKLSRIDDGKGEEPQAGHDLRSIHDTLKTAADLDQAKPLIERSYDAG